MTGRTFEIRFLDASGDTIILLVTAQKTLEDAIIRARSFADFPFAHMQIWSGLRLLTDIAPELLAA